MRGDAVKGAIFKGIEDVAKSTFGDTAWQRILETAGCKEPFFTAGDNYPDETATALIRAASEVSGLSEETVMLAFGRHWVLHTAQVTYPTLFHLAGDTARSFLMNMNRIHELVTRNLQGAHPPKFEYEFQSEQALLIHYTSKRSLCPILRGLIEGVGLYFNEDLKITETACMKNGSPKCTIKVHFP
jgi:predicted hydrocarbon binding protein